MSWRRKEPGHQRLWYWSSETEISQSPHVKDKEVLTCLTLFQVHLAEGPQIEQATCTCTIGQSQTCGHVCGLLYTLALWNKQGRHSVPFDIAKTSLPQTWHLPRGSNIQPTTFHDKLLDKFPTIYALPAIHNATSGPPVVPTKFGFVPEGCILSYQQRQHTDMAINLVGIEFPEVPVENFMVNNYCTVLTRTAATTLDSLSTSVVESQAFDKLTRDQSRNPLFFKLRANRLTASKIHRVVTRQDHFISLADSLKSGRRQTADMKRDIDMEPIAADVYCKLQNNIVNLYPSGVIVSPWSFWLAASPDRKVYDPSRVPPFGLLEIKCPNKASISEVPYLKQDATTHTLKLKRSDKYYYQVLMQLAVAGLQWCDFFVWTPHDSHLETIRFDIDEWQTVKDKVDMFYFDHFLWKFTYFSIMFKQFVTVFVLCETISKCPTTDV